MIFVQHSYAIKCHRNGYKILSLIYVHIVCFYNREKFIREMQLIRDDLRTVMIFLDWVHISNKFIEGNIKTIKRVEEVQNYKLAELLSSKLEHDPQKSHS